MSTDIRETRFTLGTRTYPIRTAIKEEQFRELADLCQNLYGSLDPRADHEKRLLLGWMFMGYKLLQVENRLQELLKQYPGAASEADENGEEQTVKERIL